MRHLIRFVTLRHFKASPGRTLLTLLGVVLGVALVFAIDVVNGSVMASFRKNIDQMAGKTALIVGESTGVEESELELVRAVEGVAVAAPVIQESVRDVERGTQLAVLAVDTLTDSEVRDYDVSADDVKIEDDLAFMNDPHGVLVTSSYAAKHAIKNGDILTLQTTKGQEPFTVRGVLAPRGPAKVFGGDLLLMDVYAAQVAFERGRRFDKIDIVPSAGVDPAELSERISKAIEKRATITRPEQRAEDAERMLIGFRLGLSVASLVAMLVGAFIVYNALAIAVAQRRREIGILRALGATRRQIVTLFIGEGILIGAIGSAFGVVLGFVLGRAALSGVGAAISELYVPVTPEELTVKPMQLVFGVAVGVGASFIAAIFPARRASFVEPASAMRKNIESTAAAFDSTSASLKASGVALLLAGAVAVAAHARESSWLGSSVAVFLAFATAFFAPVLARAIGAGMRKLTKTSSPAVRLGVINFERNAGRNAIAIAALGMALANVMNIACFLESIKQNTLSWFERSLKADVMVFAGRKVQGKYEHPLPAAVGEQIAAMPGVEFVNPLRMVRQQFRGKPFYLFAYDLPRYREHDEIPVVDGNLDEAMKEISAGTGIAASEAFSREFDIGVGDVVTLQTAGGPRDFRVALVYVDYSAELGILTTTRDVFTRTWNDKLVDSFGVYLHKGTEAAPIRERIVRDLGSNHQLMVLGNAEYKAEVVKVFDRSFALMRSMELIAIIVALLGIVNTLVVAVIDRTVELGILKAIGGVRQQVRRMFVVEAVLIGLAAGVLGLMGGVVFSLYTVKELLRFQMGWHIAWHGSPLTAMETILVAQVVAVIGAWLPMRRAAKLNVVEALQYE